MEAGKTIVKDWTPSEIDLLIHRVRENVDLYDQSRPGYSNMNIIDKCWRSVAERFSRKDAKLCKSKWQVLRGSYRTKRNKHYDSASDSDAKKIKKWAYFDAMSFLEKHLIERKTSTNILNLPTEIENDDKYHSQSLLSFETELLEINSEENCTQPLVDEMQYNLAPESRCGNVPSRKRAAAATVEQSYMQYLDRKKSKSSIRSFLDSMEEDMEKLTVKGLRRFKIEMLTSLTKHLEEQDE